MSIFSFFHLTRPGVPVFVSHNITLSSDSIDFSVTIFEKQLRYLSSNGYRSIFYKDLAELIIKNVSLPKRSYVITFDDGFLDNYVLAYPLLEKFKVKATIFVVTSWIRENDTRKTFTLNDYWCGRCSLDELKPKYTSKEGLLRASQGDPSHFMTWENLREMEKSGFVDIQSHTHTHSRNFYSDKIIGFNISRNFAVSTATDGDIRFGIPLYPSDSGLVINRYFDPPELRSFVVDYIKKNYSEEYFSSNYIQLIQDIEKEAQKAKEKKQWNGRFETDIEARERIRFELKKSREVIENKLQKKSEHLSWPWGSYDNRSIDIAIECGYKSGRLFGDRNGGGRFATLMNDPFHIEATYASHSIRKLSAKMALSNFPTILDLYRRLRGY